MRTRRRWILSLLLALLGSAFLPETFADLDVGLNPGSPLDWRIELPFHSPRGLRGPIYTHARATRKKKTSGPGHTTVVKPTVQRTGIEPRIGTFNPLSAARVLTLDIVTEMAWTGYPGPHQLPGELQYPPQLRADLYWLILAAHLRATFHPNRVSLLETIDYLIAIGPPIHDVLNRPGPSKDKPWKYLFKQVPRTPSARPSTAPILSKFTNLEQKMLAGWSCRELVADHYYAYNPRFARRTIALGEEALPILIACSESSHAILRENATALLASYDVYDEAVLERLRELTLHSDRVTSWRAFEGLVRWGDGFAEDALLDMLKRGNSYEKAYALRSLGDLRCSKAQPLALKLLADPVKDEGEMLMVVVRAAAMMGDDGGKTRAALQDVIRRVEKAGEALHIGPSSGPPDKPDPPGTRARIISQMATISLAYLGDERAQATLLSLSLDGDAVYQANKVFAVDTYAQCGDAGTGELRGVVRSSVDMTLRSRALWHLGQQGDIKFMARTAKDPLLPSFLRVAALRWLSFKDDGRDDAIAVAQKMVEQYLTEKSRTTDRATPESMRIPFYECQVAVQVLADVEPLPATTLVRVIERALEAGHHEKTKMVQSRDAMGYVTYSLNYFPPLLESVIVELGRLGYENSQWILQGIALRTDGPGRVEAALALGDLPSRQVCTTLIDLLSDLDPWVRYAAYRSLRNISGRETFTDYLGGSKSEMKAVIAEWRAWLEKEGGELRE